MSSEKKPPNGPATDEKKAPGIFILENFSSTAKLADNVGSTNTINEKDELYNPFDERNPDHPNTDAGALIHLLKSSLGTGILTMPLAFKNGGLIFSVFGTIITGILCTHCVHILVKSSHELCKRSKQPSLGYSETAEAAFEFGPPSLKKLAGFARSFVNFGLCLTYFGGNSVYVYFISSSIMDVVNQNVKDADFSIQAYMFLLLIILIPICQIRQLKYLVPFSGVANCCMAAAIGITFYYLFRDIKSPAGPPGMGEIQNLPMFFSTVIFAMEGIGVIMPLENSMKTPQHFLGCPGVLNIAMTVVITLYVTMGFFGYLEYPDIDDSITSKIPLSSIAGQAARVLIAVAILLTYALQFYVPMEICWNGSKQWFSKRFENIAQITIRTVTVVATVVVAAVVANLETLVGLVGAVCFSMLGIMIPCIVETVTCWESKTLGRFYWKLVKNILLSMFALMTLVSGSWSSIENLIHGENPETP